MTVGVIATAEGATHEVAWIRVAVQALRSLGDHRAADYFEARADRIEAETAS